MKTTDQKAFMRTFARPCEFWSSEDGDLMSLVIARSPNAKQLLKTHYAFQRERFDPRRLKPKYVQREWTGAEFFDGNGQRRGKIWRPTDSVTPFPVFEYELLR